MCLVAQLCLCPTLCDPPGPGSSVHGILQARIPEWVAMPSCRGSSQLRERTQVFHMVGRFFTIGATKSVCLSAACLLPLGDSFSRGKTPLLPLQPQQSGPWPPCHKRGQLTRPTPMRRLGTQELKSLARSMTVKTQSQNLTQRGQSPTRRTSVPMSRRSTQLPPGMKAASTPLDARALVGRLPSTLKTAKRGFFPLTYKPGVE